MSPTVWTPERDEDLRQLLTAGLSSSEVAGILSKRYKIQITKNAVIGRAGRQKIPLGCNSGRPKGEPKPAPAPKRMDRSRPDIALRNGHGGKPIPPPYVPKRAPIKPGHVSMLQLKDDMCRWPTGDGADNIRFCGMPQSESGPYCREHGRLAYQQTARRTA
jgi:GcrA cell cycle regulator